MKEDILKALKNEAFARCRYEVYAQVARREGLNYFAKILEETAKNELSHFTEFMRILGLIGDTKSNLKTAIKSEMQEAQSIYPQLYQAAMVEGELNIARLFQQIAKIETRHAQRLLKLSDLLDAGGAYKRAQTIKWKCRTCGYIHEGLEPPNKCPACQSKQESYEPEDFGI